ncbi:hypothetical protein [Flagellimonas meishanensis]|uniref:hypothetical protein n=1 Tax=Flagellimonas meishanensis TaxID=2873264 RepID=UPI001CA76085|nr:hypothetical protein [[Muricauda] meishanensis]
MSVDNSKRFFAKLTKGNGTWVHYPNDSTMAFNAFIMRFNLDKGDTLNGLISGATKAGDTLLFWNVKEYGTLGKDSTVFQQSGQVGKALGSCFFPDSLTRKAQFTLAYSNGVTQEHKDTHTFLNDSTMLTESEIFDNEIQEWVKQPNAIWTFEQHINHQNRP